MIHKETANISRQEPHQVLIHIFRRCNACLEAEVPNSRFNKRKEQTLNSWQMQVSHTLIILWQLLCSGIQYKIPPVFQNWIFSTSGQKTT